MAAPGLCFYQGSDSSGSRRATWHSGRDSRRSSSHSTKGRGSKSEGYGMDVLGGFGEGYLDYRYYDSWMKSLAGRKQGIEGKHAEGQADTFAGYEGGGALLESAFLNFGAIFADNIPGDGAARGGDEAEGVVPLMSKQSRDSARDERQRSESQRRSGACMEDDLIREYVTNLRPEDPRERSRGAGAEPSGLEEVVSARKPVMPEANCPAPAAPSPSPSATSLLPPQAAAPCAFAAGTRMESGPAACAFDLNLSASLQGLHNHQQDSKVQPPSNVSRKIKESVEQEPFDAHSRGTAVCGRPLGEAAEMPRSISGPWREKAGGESARATQEAMLNCGTGVSRAEVGSTDLNGWGPMKLQQGPQDDSWRNQRPDVPAFGTNTSGAASRKQQQEGGMAVRQQDGASAQPCQSSGGEGAGVGRFGERGAKRKAGVEIGVAAYMQYGKIEASMGNEGVEKEESDEFSPEEMNGPEGDLGEEGAAVGRSGEVEAWDFTLHDVLRVHEKAKAVRFAKWQGDGIDLGQLSDAVLRYKELQSIAKKGMRLGTNPPPVSLKEKDAAVLEENKKKLERSFGIALSQLEALKSWQDKDRSLAAEWTAWLLNMARRIASVPSLATPSSTSLSLPQFCSYGYQQFGGPASAVAKGSDEQERAKDKRETKYAKILRPLQRLLFYTLLSAFPRIEASLHFLSGKADSNSSAKDKLIKSSQLLLDAIDSSSPFMFSLLQQSLLSQRVTFCRGLISSIISSSSLPLPSPTAAPPSDIPNSSSEPCARSAVPLFPSRCGAPPPVAADARKMKKLRVSFQDGDKMEQGEEAGLPRAGPSGVSSGGVTEKDRVGVGTADSRLPDAPRGGNAAAVEANKPLKERRGFAHGRSNVLLWANRVKAVPSGKEPAKSTFQPAEQQSTWSTAPMDIEGRQMSFGEQKAKAVEGGIPPDVAGRVESFPKVGRVISPAAGSKQGWLEGGQMQNMREQGDGGTRSQIMLAPEHASRFHPSRQQKPVPEGPAKTSSKRGRPETSGTSFAEEGNGPAALHGDASLRKRFCGALQVVEGQQEASLHALKSEKFTPSTTAEARAREKSVVQKLMAAYRPYGSFTESSKGESMRSPQVRPMSQNCGKGQDSFGIDNDGAGDSPAQEVDVDVDAWKEKAALLFGRPSRPSPSSLPCMDIPPTTGRFGPFRARKKHLVKRG